MRRWRPLLPILGLSALLAACTPSIASGSDRQAGITPGRDMVVVTDGGEVILEYTIGTWKEWAEENLIAALGQSVSIGPYEQTVSSFNDFGAAELSPKGDRLALSTSAYAVLTTVSVVGILDIDDGELRLIAEPAFGGVHQFHWSPDGRYLAYPLDTARAAGDRLRLDNASELLPVIELDGEDLLEAANRSGHEATVDSRQWLPAVRDLEWSEGSRLQFTTDGFTGDELHWSLVPESGELSVE